MKIKELRWNKDRCNHYKAWMQIGNSSPVLYSFGETNGSIFANKTSGGKHDFIKWDLKNLDIAKHICEQDYKEEYRLIYECLFES
jgi:hypothetical protein